VVRSAGGWLFDQVMAGWDITVVTPGQGDPRPLRILGARVRGVDAVLGSSAVGRCLQAVAVCTKLYDTEPRVREVVRAALLAGAEVRFWDGTLPEEFDTGAEPIAHRLSLAARAFKAQALAAAAEPASSTERIEVFLRPESRRSALVR
jgi:hypothetical protein